MKLNSEQVIENLEIITHENKCFAKELLEVPNEQIHFKISENSWSVLECLEHLNRYGNYYIHEFNLQIKNTLTVPEIEYKTGLLGQYFVESIRPKEGGKKMKTLQKMNPIKDQLDTKVIETFIQQQKEILEILSKSRKVSLKKTKIRISIASWLYISLGDALRFFIYHHQRHVLQAKKALEQSRLS